MSAELLPAQLDLGEWVESAVVLVIIGVSALSGVGNAIAKKLREKREQASEGIGTAKPMTSAATPARPKPAQPVARPLPPRMPPRTGPTRPAVPPAPARPVPPRQGTVPTPSLAEPLVKAEVEVPEETAIPRVRPVSAVGGNRPRRAKVRQPYVDVDERPMTPPQRTAVEEAEERTAGLVEQRIGHVDEGTVPPDERHERSPQRRVARRFAVRTLRRAIVLSEILAPPLAIRPPGDRRG